MTSHSINHIKTSGKLSHNNLTVIPSATQLYFFEKLFSNLTEQNDIPDNTLFRNHLSTQTSMSNLIARGHIIDSATQNDINTNNNNRQHEQTEPHGKSNRMTSPTFFPQYTVVKSLNDDNFDSSRDNSPYNTYNAGPEYQNDNDDYQPIYTIEDEPQVMQQYVCGNSGGNFGQKKPVINQEKRGKNNNTSHKTLEKSTNTPPKLLDNVNSFHNGSNNVDNYSTHSSRLEFHGIGRNGYLNKLGTNIEADMLNLSFSPDLEPPTLRFNGGGYGHKDGEVNNQIVIGEIEIKKSFGKSGGKSMGKSVESKFGNKIHSNQNLGSEYWLENSLNSQIGRYNQSHQRNNKTSSDIYVHDNGYEYFHPDELSNLEENYYQIDNNQNENNNKNNNYYSRTHDFQSEKEFVLLSDDTLVMPYNATISCVSTLPSEYTASIRGEMADREGGERQRSRENNQHNQNNQNGQLNRQYFDKNVQPNKNNNNDQDEKKNYSNHNNNNNNTPDENKPHNQQYNDGGNNTLIPFLLLIAIFILGIIATMLMIIITQSNPGNPPQIHEQQYLSNFNDFLGSWNGVFVMFSLFIVLFISAVYHTLTRSQFGQIGSGTENINQIEEIVTFTTWGYDPKDLK
jgi:hypothetical protein